MGRKSGEKRGETEDLLSGMGRERMALRARKATIMLTTACSFVCLGTALAGFTGYVLPHAVGPALVFLLAALAGFALCVAMARRPRW